jgi:hypothetical protein
MFSRALAGVLAPLVFLSAEQSHSPSDVEEVVRQADKSRQEYVSAFRDVIGVETRVTELVNKNGTAEKQRTVVSDFLVYRSRFQTDAVTECRIAREVDGKTARNPRGEAMQLFRELAKARTASEENRALREQNAKHILRFLIWGLTTYPIPWVQQHLRRGFDFTVGHDDLAGRDAIVLGYQSKEPGPATTYTTLFRRFKNPRSSWRGRVWMDSRDWHIRRWVEDLMVVDDDITSPDVLLHKEIEYVPSPLGGNLPARILTSNFDKTGGKTAHMLNPVTRITFTYDGFKRFDVTTDAKVK